MANIVTDLALQAAWTHQRLRNQAMTIARLAANSIPQSYPGDCDTVTRIWVKAARSHSKQVVRALRSVRQSQLVLL